MISLVENLLIVAGVLILEAQRDINKEGLKASHRPPYMLFRVCFIILDNKSERSNISRVR